MVRSLILGFTGSLLLASIARAELQLTPSLVEREGDGCKFKQLAFHDGEMTITYLSPPGWSYSGSATQLTLRPLKTSQAEASITRVPRSEPGQFDDDSLKKLVAKAVALVPNGSSNVTVESQEKNPLLINRKETFLIVLSYNLFGQAYSRSILFLNRGKEQIRFELVCRSADFKELQKAFLRSQYSWDNL
jgi:hypothetical protein